MPEILFAHQWTIPEHQLLPLKDSENGRLKTSKITNIPEFQYYFGISPNGHTEEHRGETYVFLLLDFINVKKVTAKYTYTIESANYSEYYIYTYNQSKGWGPPVCSTVAFFDPENKYIVDGKFTIKINGVFEYEIEDTISDVIKEYKWNGGELGNELWENDEIKDFTIITSDGKEIKVHKFILLTRSEFFKEMLNTCSTESSVEINDFPFTVVEAAFKIIYNCNFTSFLSVNELMELQRFFDKYLFSTFKNRIEPLLINQISASTVVQLTNCSVKTNSPKLKEKCIEFLIASFESKTALSDIEILDKNIAIKILQSLLYQNISNTTITSEQQKWIGGVMGDALWQNNDTKDFAILVGRREIKVHKLVIDSRFPMLIEMFKMKEIKIDNYYFKVVVTAIKIIYNCNFTTSLCVDELMQLLKFFFECNLTALSDKVETLLIAKISPTTVVDLTNCSIRTHSLKLKEKCIKFLSTAFESKIAITYIDDLDNDVKSKLLKDSLYQTLETDKQ